MIEMMLSDFRNRWEIAGSYRHLLRGIRLQILCHIGIGDISHQGRRLGAMTMRAHIGTSDIKTRIEASEP